MQANAFSASGAKRTEATQQNSIFAARARIDVMAWISYLEHRQAGDANGAEFLKERFREEFKPTFNAWMAIVPAGGIPPGTPFDLRENDPESRRFATRPNAEADEPGATAREANQIGDNFVLIAVIMASVLFFAGVGTKVEARGIIRLFMLSVGTVLFLSGVTFMLSLPQSFGIWWAASEESRPAPHSPRGEPLDSGPKATQFRTVRWSPPSAPDGRPAAKKSA